MIHFHQHKINNLMAFKFNTHSLDKLLGLGVTKLTDLINWFKLLSLSFFIVILNGCQSTPINTPSTTPTMHPPPMDINAPSDSNRNDRVIPYKGNEPNSDSNNIEKPSAPTLVIQTQPDNATPATQIVPFGSSDKYILRGHANNPNIEERQPNLSQPTEANTNSESVDMFIIEQPVPSLDPSLDARKAQQILLERARSNSHNPTTASPVLENGDNVPAFQRLMDTGISQLANGQYSAADSTFTRAQRLAPQSSAVYFYMGQVALKRNQPRRAEAMARRGLVVAQSNSRRTGLWKVILLAGQMQGSQSVIQEAQQALAALQ